MVSRGVAYVPGDGTAVAGGWFVALVAAPASDPLVVALGDLAARSVGSIDDVIEVLIAHRLRDLPSFSACCRSAEQTQLLARGPVIAALDDVEIHGIGLRTWIEHAVALSVDVKMWLDGESTSASPEHWVSNGMVPARRLEWNVDADLARHLPVVPQGTEVARTTPGSPATLLTVPGLGWLPDPVEAEPAPAAESVELELGLPPEPEPETALELETDDPAGTGVLDGPAVVPSEATTFEISDDGDGSAGAEPEPSTYDHLFHATQHRSIEGAAVRPDVAERRGSGAPETVIESVPGSLGSGAPSLDADATAGDHDGHTRTLSAIQRSRTTGSSTPGTPEVAASRCPNGHVNPPNTPSCRSCGSPMLPGTELIHRPIVGMLVLPTGERIAVDRTTVVGRAPQASGTFEGVPPRLVTLADNQDISRTHLVIEVSEWTATVTDRSSRNGTVLHLPGLDPELLRGGVPAVVVSGSELVLAESITLGFEAI